MSEPSQNMQESTNDTFVVAFPKGDAYIKNPYSIWQSENLQLYIKIELNHNNKTVYTYIDFNDRSKLAKYDNKWCIVNSYAGCSSLSLYIHHIITGFIGSGKGFSGIGGLSVNHLDRDRLNNRKSNLSIDTMQQQQENSKGRIEGTKRDRQYSAKDLPLGITQEMVPQLVNYIDYTDTKGGRKTYFVIDNHPLHKEGIIINGYRVPQAVKSRQALFLGSGEPYPPEKKLQEIIIKIKKLNQVYKNWNKKDLDITIVNDKIIDDICTPRDNGKIIYIYDKDWHLIKTCKSVGETAKVFNVSEQTIRRNYSDKEKPQMYGGCHICKIFNDDESYFEEIDEEEQEQE